jgi:hypothetical protein
MGNSGFLPSLPALWVNRKIGSPKEIMVPPIFKYDPASKGWRTGAVPERDIQTKGDKAMTEHNSKEGNRTPDFYIFAKHDTGNSTRIGVAFKHAKGTGFNILIDDKRYTAFPPKSKT